jgi:type IV pilus assembly protein PilM
MSFISDILKKKTTSALGIDIGTSSIKVVQLQKKGNKAILETYGELSLGPYGGVSVGQSTNLTTDKIAQAMNDLLNEKEVAITTKVCGLAIPFKASLLLTMEMPDVGQKEMASMVPIEARKYIPVPTSDVTIDWSVIPRSELEENISKEKNQSKVKTVDILLVAIHNNIINQYREIVAKTQLDAKFFEIEVFSSMRAILEGVQWPVMIFDMGASTTKLYTVDRGLIQYSHTINKGSQDITSNIARILNIPIEEAEVIKRSIGMGKTAEGVDLSEAVSVVADGIFSEANRFLYDFQKKKNQNMKSVFLTGGGSALRGFRDLAAQNFKTEVISGDPFEKVETPAFLENILKVTGPEFTVAVGAALRCLQEI